MALLRIQTGPRSGTFVPLQESSVVLGRGDKVAVRVPDQGSSRQHAEVFRMGELFFIRDLKSRNGTFVNERRVQEAVLREGDQIRIGDTVVLFLEREDSPQARVIRLDNGTATMDRVRFRDTVVGVPPPPPSPESAPREAAPPREASPRREKGAPSLVRRVAQIMAGDQDLKAVLAKVVREAGQALGADRADIILIESLEPELRFRPVATFDTKGEGEVTLSRTILTEAIERQEALLTSDAAADRRFGEAESVIAHAIRSVICVPLMPGGATAGVLYLSSSQRADAFDREDLDTAAQVGFQLSASLGTLRTCEAREEVLREALLLAVGAPRSGEKGSVERASAVAGYSRAIARSLGLKPEEVNRAWVAGLLHSIGRSEPADGGAGAAGSLWSILEAIQCQDERHNGRGSPGGRVGDEIPLLGRILSLAKELDRLTCSGGPEGGALPIEDALGRMREAAGDGFHPDVVQALLVAHRNGLLQAGANPLPPGL